MRRSRGGAAFYVETLLLVLFLLASLTVLVQILGAAKRTSREARELSTAVSIAQNAAELFAASGSQEDFAALLGAEKTARGTLRAAYDVQGGWTEDETQGAYVLEAVLDETPRQAGEMRTAIRFCMSWIRRNTSADNAAGKGETRWKAGRCVWDGCRCC